MVIALAGRKGGTGKSTAALHLAGALEARGSVAVLDLDSDNLSCATYAEAGRLPFEVFTADTWPTAASRSWAFVVIDAPARPTREQLEALASRADLLVTPSPPDATSLRVLGRMLPDLRDLSAPYRVLVNRAPPRPSRDADRARIDLERALVPTFETTIPEVAVMRHAARRRCLAWNVPLVRGSHVRLAFEALAREVIDYADTQT